MGKRPNKPTGKKPKGKPPATKKKDEGASRKVAEAFEKAGKGPGHGGRR